MKQGSQFMPCCPAGKTVSCRCAQADIHRGIAPRGPLAAGLVACLAGALRVDSSRSRRSRRGLGRFTRAWHEQSRRSRRFVPRSIGQDATKQTGRGRPASLAGRGVADLDAEFPCAAFTIRAFATWCCSAGAFPLLAILLSRRASCACAFPCFLAVHLGLHLRLADVAVG
jgi:hypothetical protein